MSTRTPVVPMSRSPHCHHIHMWHVKRSTSSTKVKMLNVIVNSLSIWFAKWFSTGFQLSCGIYNPATLEYRMKAGLFSFVAKMFRKGEFKKLKKCFQPS